MKTQTNYLTWTPETWYGNPSLNLDCRVKTFKNRLNNGRKVNVWIHGGTKDYPGFSFTVSAGIDSEYSYTGLCLNCKTMDEATQYVDSLYAKNQLFK